MDINKKKVIGSCIFGATIVLVIILFIFSPKTTTNSVLSQNSAKDIERMFIVRAPKYSYKYLPNEINSTLELEDGHVMIPTRFRKEVNRCVVEPWVGDTKDFNIAPVIGDKDFPQNGKFRYYKILYTTNIQPQEYVYLKYANDIVCVMPIIEKGLEEFRYETYICFDDQDPEWINQILDNLSVCTEGHEDTYPTYEKFN